MSRTLSETEKEQYIANRPVLHKNLSELQADFEDLPDRDLIECRDVILNRINTCLAAILETDEDNLT